MQDYPQPPKPTPEPIRPRMLAILCILTFIGSGLNIFSSLFISAFFETFQVVAEELIERFDLPGLDAILNATPSFFLISALLYGGSVTGAVMMWQLRRIGFHFYTIAQILLLIDPMYFLNLHGPSILDLLITGLFVVLYSTQLKQMH